MANTDHGGPLTHPTSHLLFFSLHPRICLLILENEEWRERIQPKRGSVASLHIPTGDRAGMDPHPGTHPDPGGDAQHLGVPDDVRPGLSFPDSITCTFSLSPPLEHTDFWEGRRSSLRR